MKVYRIQSTYYDIDGEYISLLDDVYISKKIAENINQKIMIFHMNLVNIK